jgi:hypothetical protein
MSLLIRLSLAVVYAWMKKGFQFFWIVYIYLNIIKNLFRKFHLSLIIFRG